MLLLHIPCLSTATSWAVVSLRSSPESPSAMADGTRSLLWGNTQYMTFHSQAPLQLLLFTSYSTYSGRSTVNRIENVYSFIFSTNVLCALWWSVMIIRVRNVFFCVCVIRTGKQGYIQIDGGAIQRGQSQGKSIMVNTKGNVYLGTCPSSR
jgi:hypothetical protein